MNDLQLLLSVTISEFEVLRDLGALRVDPARIVMTRVLKSAGYGPEVDAQLLAKLPEFLPGEDHSVLILAFQGLPPGERAEDSMSAFLSGRVTLSARHCSQVIPLTRRARGILSGRLHGQVVLDEPLFEDLIEGHLARIEKQSSLSGAKSLVRALVENHAEFRQGRLRDAMEGADHPLRVLLDSAIRYTRYKPMPQEPVSGLRDLGGLLKESAVAECELPLKQLGEWLRPRQEEFRGFRKLYSDSGLVAILAGVTRAWDLPASAASFAIFLHWRYLASQARGVDLDAVAADCQQLVSCIDGQAVVDALWLLGFSSGFEAVAAGCYQRMGEKHPFNPTGRPGKRVTLLSLPPVATQEPVVTQPTAGDTDELKPEDTSPASEQDQVAAQDSGNGTEKYDQDGKADPQPEGPGSPEESESASASGTSETTIATNDAGCETEPRGTVPAESASTPDPTAIEPLPPETSSKAATPARKKPASRKEASKKIPDEPSSESEGGDFHLEPS